MRLQFGITTAQRVRGNLPELPILNMFVEEAPTEELRITLQSRPGLTDRALNMGAGPVQALFKGDGVLTGGLYGVSATTLYEGTTSRGALNGSGVFSMAGYEDKLFAAGGGSLWGWDGVTLAAVAVPDSANVTKVVVGASRVIIIRADTEQFYWSDVLSSTISALSFATAESQPDRLKDLLFINDILILFGSETVEFWPNTGDAVLPFQPLESQVFEKGIKATGCAAKFGATFAWVTNNNQVCLSDPDNIISDSGLEAKIEAATSVRLFTYYIEGTEFLAVRLNTETHVFSARSKLWSQNASDGQANWLATCYAGGVFGSALNGVTMAWGANHTDLGGIMERRFRAGAAINSGGLVVDNLSLRNNPGQTPYLTGLYADPEVEMRTSRDGGQTWGEWRSAKLGAQGAYRTKPLWLSLGMFSHPGILVEFRVTDPVPFRVSDVRANEPYGGI